MGGWAELASALETLRRAALAAAVMRGWPDDRGKSASRMSTEVAAEGVARGEVPVAPAGLGTTLLAVMVARAGSMAMARAQHPSPTRVVCPAKMAAMVVPR